MTHHRCPRLAAGALAVLTALSSACATTQVDRRARAVTSADQEAKRALAAETQIDPTRIPARSLGILPFAASGSDTVLQSLGYAMAEFLMTDLSRSTEVQVVDRLRTEAILRELDLVDKGTVDPRSAPRVGKLVGARRLLIGDLHTAPNGAVQFDARIVDVLAGTVQTLVSATAPLDRAIDAEKVLALRVFEQLGITLTPAQRVAVEQRQTTNLAATVAFGKGLEAEAKGDVGAAATLFEEAAKRDATFLAARNQGAASSSSRSSGTQRVLALSAQAINAPVPSKLPEAADVAIAARTLSLLITLRVF
jgi:TolB-like protein